MVIFKMNAKAEIRRFCPKEALNYSIWGFCFTTGLLPELERGF